MARILSQKRIYVLFFCILEFCTCSDDFTCVQENECLCKFSNDRVIDISRLSDEYNVTQGNSTYFFFGCRNGNVPDSIYNIPNNCKNTSLCLYNATTNQLVNLGSKSQMKFKQSEYDSQVTEIVYTMQQIVSRVLLVCSPELSKSIFLISTKSEYNLLMISPFVCKFTSLPHGLSTGSTLLVLFLVGCTIYFVGGAVVLHCLRGARGTEMIPNIDFWRDLPNLVRDGLIFLLNGCRPTAVATAESYDRI